MPNLYPAFRRQEVVVSVPRHARSLAELDDAELTHIAAAWQQRAAVARSEGFPYVHALLNEGAAAGASLPHTHTQLVWLDEPPPLVTSEHTAAGACGVCELTGRSEYLLAERDGVAALVHPAGRLPYEILIAPRAHEAGAFETTKLSVALTLLGETIRRLHSVEGHVPLNAWVHANDHWHIELVPRLSTLAGIELGAGIFVNALPPEVAATALRAAAAG